MSGILEKDLEGMVEQYINNNIFPFEYKKDRWCKQFEEDDLRPLNLKQGVNNGIKEYRQLRIGNYGIADLVYFSRNSNKLIVNVIELKKGKIGLDAYVQAYRYYQGIKDYIHNFRSKEIELVPNIILIGSSIDNDSDFVYIYSNTDCLTVYSYSFCYLSGLVWKEECKFWCLKYKGFK